MILSCRKQESSMNLSLGEAVKSEVSDTYKIKLKSNGHVLIKIPNFYTDNPMKILSTGNLTAALIPLDVVTRTKTSEIDRFVQENVVSTLYKPIWKGENICINFSRWCKYEKLLNNGSHQEMLNETLGSGRYSIAIQASHVYIGPHKGGQTYSVALHIVEVLYEPEDSLTEFINSVVETFNPQPATASQTKTKQGNRRKCKEDAQSGKE